MMFMEDQEKLALLEDIMDLESGALSPDDAFDSLEDWDSMSALSFVILLDEKFHRKITGQQIRAFVTVRDAMNFMCNVEAAAPLAAK